MLWYSTLMKAVSRIEWELICHVKAGNDEYDRRRTHMQAGEKARAHIKFEEISKKRKRDEASISEPHPNPMTLGKSNHSNDPAANTLSSRSARGEPNLDSSQEDSSYKSSSEQGKSKRARKNKKRKRRKHPAKGDAESSKNAGESPNRINLFILMDVVQSYMFQPKRPK